MDDAPAPETPKTKPALTKLDLVFRFEIWLLALFLALGGAAAGFGLGKTLQTVGFAGFFAMMMAIFLTPTIALPFVARRRDPPLATALSWLVRLSGLGVLALGVALALGSTHLPLLGLLTGVPLAAIGVWAIAHTW